MHLIEPFYRWESYYVAAEDERSPFYGNDPMPTQYQNAIYGYYIHPSWDEIGSETLYMKLLFADYEERYAILEFIGEWNDTLHNDVMHLKRNVVDWLCQEGINQFILIGENVLNFHGSDDCYYEEWFEDVEEGWVAAINFREFVLEEMSAYNLDSYINYGGALNAINWRTMSPPGLFQVVQQAIVRRLGM